jgi:hypothetical protein
MAKVGIEIAADVDQARSRLNDFGKGMDKMGSGNAATMRDLEKATNAAQTAMRKLGEAQTRVNDFKFAKAIQEMRRYEAAIRDAARAGQGLPGFGSSVAGPGGGGGGGSHAGAPAPRVRYGSGGQRYELAGTPARWHRTDAAETGGGGFGMGSLLGFGMRGAALLGLPLTAMAIGGRAIGAEREASGLRQRSDTLWRRLGGARGNYDRFHPMMRDLGLGLQTSPDEAIEYGGLYARGTRDANQEELRLGTKAGVGLSVGLGIDRGVGVSAVASNAFWNDKQTVGGFAVMLARGLVDAGAFRQSAEVIQSFSAWQAQAGARGGPAAGQGWWELLGGLSRTGSPSAQGAAGAHMLQQWDTGFSGAMQNPAAVAMMAGALRRQGVTPTATGVREIMESGPFADVAGTGQTAGQIFISDLKRRSMSDDMRKEALHNTFGMSLHNAGRLLEGYGLVGQGGDGDVFNEYMRSRGAKGLAGTPSRTWCSRLGIATLARTSGLRSPTHSPLAGVRQPQDRKTRKRLPNGRPRQRILGIPWKGSRAPLTR